MFILILGRNSLGWVGGEHFNFDLFFYKYLGVKYDSQKFVYFKSNIMFE